MRNAWYVLAVPAILGFAVSEADADLIYDFSRIATAAPGGSNITAPVLNDFGVVAYRDAQGVHRAGGTSSPELIEATSARPRSLSINNLGHVSYTKFTGPASSQLLVNDGSVSNPVFEENNQTFSILGSSLNNSNRVVTAIQSLDPALSGVYASQDGQFASRVYAPGGNITNFDPYPVINDASAVAFLAFGSFGPRSTSAIVLGDLTGSSPTIVARDSDFFSDASDSGSFYSAFDLNDRGEVAFVTFVRSSIDPGTTRYGLHVAAGGSISTITSVVSTGAAFSEDGVSLNNDGSVAFHLATAGIGGIYTGGDLLHDKLIADGDELDGGRVFGLRFGRFGLNNAGQIAFHATVIGDDGRVREGIYLATPRISAVPEPTAAALLGSGLVAVALTYGMRRRRLASCPGLPHLRHPEQPSAA